MNRRFSSGLVVGKFAPLHRGHELVIHTALEQCDTVYVLSYSRPEFAGCEPHRRVRWLEKLFPETQRLVLDNAAASALGLQRHHPANDAPEGEHRDFVADVCETVFHTRVQAVVGSDDYMEPFAAHLSGRFKTAEPGHPGVTAVLVDPARIRLPVSGTLLREDVHAHRQYLSPQVYADFAVRVCLLGGESSGKSTLAEHLAREWDTTWVHEFGREYWIEKGGVLTFDELTHIGRVQCQWEEEAAGRANRFLFCDTTPLTTLFYCQHEFGRASAELEHLATRPYDLTLLCAPDFPHVQDGSRQPSPFRDLQHAWYLRELEERGVPYTLLQGDISTRIATVRHLLEALPSVLRTASSHTQAASTK